MLDATALRAPSAPNGLRELLAELAGRTAAALEAAFAGHPELPPTIERALEFLRSRDAGGTDPRKGGRIDSKQDALPRLIRALGLSQSEVDLLLFAGMAEEHEGYAEIFRSLHPASLPRPSAGLAAQVLCHTEHDRLALRATLLQGPAVRTGLLMLEGDGPFFERTLRVADAAWPALLGIDVWPAGVTVLAVSATEVSAVSDWLDQADTRLAMAALRRCAPCLIMLNVGDGCVGISRAAILAAAAGRAFAALRLLRSDFARLCGMVQVHAGLRNAVPVVLWPEADGTGDAGGTMEAALAFPDLADTVVVVAGAGAALPGAGARPRLAVCCERLSLHAITAGWRSLLPELAREAPVLAARYPLEPATAASIATDVQFAAQLAQRRPATEDVSASMRIRLSPRPLAGIGFVGPSLGWDRLVLPADTEAQLREAVGRLHHQQAVFEDWRVLAGRRGARGVRMLFWGAPGTGKSLAAEVLAAALGTDLMIVDLSRVVSKWIGETEKNLAEAFAAAERARAVLLFDEADALFGKRTEVTDAHDRYANLETAYLLTRLELYEGLAVLTSNLKQNIDPAFLRRLEFVVQFPEPDREQRLALWRCHLPPQAPLAADVDLDALVDLYPVVGGVIRNAAAAAAFLAAGEGSAIAHRHLVHALRREYAKTGRAFPGEVRASSEF